MLKKARANFSKNFLYFAILVIAGALLMCWLNYYNAKRDFEIRTNKRVNNNAVKLNDQIDNFLIYSENLTRLVSNNISQQNTRDPNKIAKILENIRPKIDYAKYNIFALSLFNFVNEEGRIIATSSGGVMKENLFVSPIKRPWLISAKLAPWKFQIVKSDIGIVSKEPIIPIGFGVTNENGKFLGFISLGINAVKLVKALETSLIGHSTSFVILNDDNSAIIASENFDQTILRNIKSDLDGKTDKENAKILIRGQQFFYSKIRHYPNLSILVGNNKDAARAEFLSLTLPGFLNYLYFTVFFLALLYFFKVKLLNPVIILSSKANKISQGHTDTYIPRSQIAEIDSLAQSICMVRDFVKKQNEEKLLAERENQNKSDFLSSTAHEFKNIIASIVGISEIIKSNFIAKSESKNHYFTSDEIRENKEFLDDIIKLSDEISSFIYDVIDVNQAATGNFKIEESETVDIRDIVLKSVKLLKIRAIKNKKHIVTQFSKGLDTNFNINNLDPRRIKQILVNILSNSIKYAKDNSRIEVKIEALDKEVSDLLRDSLVQNIRQNQDLDKLHKKHLMEIINKGRPRVIITIKDYGGGMSEEELKVAMEKYGRLENSKKPFIDSTGLGLPIVKYLVEMQGGMINISSKKDVGTEVRIIF